MKCGHSSDTQGHVHCFCPSLRRAVFHPRCREILWLELSSQSQSGGVSSTPCVTAYSEPLALTEGGFFIRLSHKSIVAGLPCLFPPQHPSLPTFLFGPSPVSNRVRNLLAWRPLLQIQSMLIWPRRKNAPLADHSIKMDIFFCFHQWDASMNNYRKKSCWHWYRNGSLCKLDSDGDWCSAAMS